MAKFIIDVEEGIHSDVALRLVAAVVHQGKISNTNIEGQKVPHYCWITEFDGDIIVSTRRKRKANSADSFRVHYSYKKFLK